MQEGTGGPAAPDSSPDSEDRIQDFLARHGGAGGRSQRRVSDPSHTHGWTEVYAADGYTLRCDWSQVGSKDELRFSEFAPGADAPGAGDQGARE